MDDCTRIKDYLARLLDRSNTAHFEAHLHLCETCKIEVAEARRVDKAANDYFAAADVPSVSLKKAERLAGDAKNTSLDLSFMCVKMAAAALICAVCTSVGIYVLLGSQKPEFKTEAISKLRPKETNDAKISALDSIKIMIKEGGKVFLTQNTNTPVLKVDEDGRIVARTAKARLGLGSKSHLEVLSFDENDARFVLKRGSCAFDVEPRNGDGRFSVRVGNRDIEVVGTVFQVTKLSKEGVRVAVLEGEVMIYGPYSHEQKVAPGEVVEVDGSAPLFSSVSSAERRELADLLEIVPKSYGASRGSSKVTSKVDNHHLIGPGSSSQTAVFDLGRVRRLILQREFDDAMHALNKQLAQHPSDTEALALKGDCLRKQGSWEKAVAAYSMVSRKAGPRAANRARLSAAVLLQDKLGNQHSALKYLKSYLAQSKSFRPMEAEVMYRLARAYQDVGSHDKANKLLERISNEHGGTAAALEARRVLKKR